MTRGNNPFARKSYLDKEMDIISPQTHITQLLKHILITSQTINQEPTEREKEIKRRVQSTIKQWHR